jgi:hypothetical protein
MAEVASGYLDNSLYGDFRNMGSLSMTGSPAKIDHDFSVGVSVKPCSHCGLHAVEAISTEEYSHKLRRIVKTVIYKCIDCGREQCGK